MNKPLIFIGLLAALVSCNSGKKVDREVFDEVNKSMEVKKVSEVDILEKSLEWGSEISQEAQQQLMKILQEKIAENGIPGAVEFCHVEALPILKEVSEKHGVTIRRVSNDYRNPDDRPNEDEAPLLEAYEYNEENGIKSEPNVQSIQSDEVLLYTRAIKIPNGLCLNCHGDPEKDIAEETLKKLDELYPEDKAKGHQVGDLRGIWSIAIPKKEVVKKL